MEPDPPRTARSEPGDVGKRVFDVAVASIALIILAPLLLALAALIRLTSRGPAFFRQRRRGLNGAEFRIWKFRTMTTMDDGGIVAPAKRGDARLTWVGRYLRRLNLDELPQLVNVLKGEMSIVGPRPHAIGEDLIFEQWLTDYSDRKRVAPGMTGWAQVNGWRGPAVTVHALRRRVEHDLYYIDNRSMGFDLYIVALTLLSPKAYRNAH